MKAKLTFNLPEDKSNYLVTVNAMEFALTCWDMDQFLRSKLKYGHTYKNIDEALEDCREKLAEVMINYNITLNMIE